MFTLNYHICWSHPIGFLNNVYKAQSNAWFCISRSVRLVCKPLKRLTQRLQCHSNLPVSADTFYFAVLSFLRQTLKILHNDPKARAKRLILNLASSMLKDLNISINIHNATVIYSFSQTGSVLSCSTFLSRARRSQLKYAMPQ